jgi:hypothetical protein
MEVIQNSPQRQASWLKGQNIFPHACDPPTSTRHFSDSANRKAASISLVGCFARFKRVSRIVAFALVVNRQPIILIKIAFIQGFFQGINVSNLQLLAN